MLSAIIAQIVTWAVSIGLLVMPMGGVPQAIDYRSIAKPNAQTMADKGSDRKGKIVNETARDAGIAMLRTFLGSVNDKDIDRSVMVKAIEAMPIRKAGDTNRTQAKEGLLPPMMKGVRDYQLFLSPTKEANTYEFVADYAQNNGKQMQAKTGIHYNSKTNEVFSGNQSGVIGTKRNINLKHIFFFNETATWQQNFGFNALYDVLGNLLLYDLAELRVKFPYDGKDWMFQLWKGSYTVVSNGFEIGIYEKPQSRKIGHYDCSDLRLNMKASLYRGKTLMLTHEIKDAWWLTSFQPGIKLNPDDLIMDSSITFDDSKMQKLFVETLRKEAGVTNIAQNGRTVSFRWQ